ncbi:Transport particle subunit trs85-2 [Hyphodiscus hymeniophilus]|uniref:Transport particle subunit trs85-2 n=1 Tax=Hyphodiscus hymeniophilus TaxID=353542 RepID=A0A9P6VNB9_9HELO|nr:Transport particle subunit trs85-2 [Hyphodiscus hymeniophilus]
MPGQGQALAPADTAADPRNLVLQAFVPHIAVHTSEDTHELIKDKGFEFGLWELLRPFGERIQGKVNVRDSIGSGKTYEDFAVRFVQLGDGLEGPEVSRRSGEGKGPNTKVSSPISAQRARTGGDVAQIESLVDRHLTHAEEYPALQGEDYKTIKDARSRNQDYPSPFYTLYLRRLLSGIPMAPHETFSHPVACIIAISSRNKDPIQALRKLYDESTNGERRLPPWVSNEYLRYYVLVHDEEQDDITKSITLFEQMKRHFGLHCHLLRLRSSECVSSDDDSVQHPRCEWLSASEELVEIQTRETLEDVEESLPCIYESDTTAIKTFIREMVTQSVIPSMERCISTWNDQVASRRRGISGRFMSLSKKWAFGSSSRSTSNGPNAPTSNSNYDAVQGFYRPEVAEAIMRKLGDYAFMLRDWKLAQSTYELLRTDFNNDKAWRYHAAANEMAAISTLLIPQAMSSKVRTETVDQMLETASYSYITRCGASYGALRALALGMELLRLRGGSATDDAAKWGARLLDHKVVGVIGDALMKERISACYASKKGAGSGRWGSRARKSALWSILAADSWLTLGKPQQAKLRLDEATQEYAELRFKDGLENFGNAWEFLLGLRREVDMAMYPDSALEGTLVPELETEVGEETQDFVAKPHRMSLMGVHAPVLGGLESSPLHGAVLEGEQEETGQVQFE